MLVNLIQIYEYVLWALALINVIILIIGGLTIKWKYTR